MSPTDIISLGTLVSTAIKDSRKMRSLAIRAALAAVLVIVVNGETFESHSIYPHAIISKKTDTHRPNLQIPELQEYQDQFDVRKRREADPESNKPRPQQVPPRPPHPVSPHGGCCT
ncbi:hypothetical protein HZH68_005948 [Vespula germanica]|uniref:Uncharacterized protein n=1 Tax=Vespula germanica TaxID=30212 RepID=A0A834NFZ5_VESGE|nr:hypothetical protein HZH68_005948 [Vespula germanica]